MMNIKKVKKILVLTLVTVFIMASFVSAQSNEDVFNQYVEEGNYYQCFHEDHQGIACDRPADHQGYDTLDIDIEDIGVRAISCSRCSGYITQRKVGTGYWDYVSATKCNMHANCSLQKYERSHYYEERCGGTCGYVRKFDVPEYEYRHK